MSSEVIIISDIETDNEMPVNDGFYIDISPEPGYDQYDPIVISDTESDNDHDDNIHDNDADDEDEIEDEISVAWQIEMQNYLKMKFKKIWKKRKDKNTN